MSNHRFRFAIIIVALVGVRASAQHTSNPKSTLRHEGLIDAPIHEVWNAFTTTEGLKSWMAPLADIELRVGGKMRVNYNPGRTLGDEKTIENTILSFEPERMLSIQATRPPAGFPFPTAIKDMWTVLRFEPVGADHTRLIITGMGFGESEESVKMRDFFDKGNAHTLEQLRKKFAGMPSTSAIDPLKILHQLVGGEWVFEDKRDNGSVFRGRNVTERGPDSKSLIVRGWLGDAKGMFYHSAMQIWRDAESSALRFQSLDENGGLATGEIVSAGENAVSWDWNVSALSGKKSRYRVDMVFADADHYEFILHEVKVDDTTVERVRVQYARVSESPEEFRKLKPTKDN